MVTTMTPNPQAEALRHNAGLLELEATTSEAHAQSLLDEASRLREEADEIDEACEPCATRGSKCGEFLTDPDGYRALCTVRWGTEHSHHDRTARAAVAAGLAEQF